MLYQIDKYLEEFENDNIINSDQKHVDSILEEFDVDTDEELVEKINQDALTIPCYKCRNEFKLGDLNWVDGDPFCDDHYDEIEEGLYD